jgi:hypothetical protein
MTMKKITSGLLAALMLSTGLIGCAPDNPSDKTTEPVQKDQAKQPDKSKEQQPNGQTAPADTQKDPSHDEIKTAFNLGDQYMYLPFLQLSSLATGGLELGLEQKQRIAFAKAISSGLGELGWQQTDLPPAIFIVKDGSAFAIGLKRQDGKFVLNRYERQADETYKLVKQETK